MTNEQIFKQAIEKAEKGGFEFRPGVRKDSEFYEDLMESLIENFSYFAIIFSHNFAKPFWGYKEENCELCGVTLIEGISHMPNCYYNFNGLTYVPPYLWHLQQMVLEEQPLLYLKRFL